MKKCEKCGREYKPGNGCPGCKMLRRRKQRRERDSGIVRHRARYRNKNPLLQKPEVSDRVKHMLKEVGPPLFGCV